MGDALGFQVEFDRWDAIQEEFGPQGVDRMLRNKISDDTQMTLFTAEGLLLAAPGEEVEEVRLAYLRWLQTQREPMPPMGSEGLAAQPWLYSRRAPGNACVSGLRDGARPGVNPDSKGCGTVMRSAPFGLRFDPQRAFDLAEQCSALTHGHPTAGASAGAFAMITAHLMNGDAPQRAVSDTLHAPARGFGPSETADVLQRRTRWPGGSRPDRTRANRWAGLDRRGGPRDRRLLPAGTDDVRAGLTASVSHSGDSDSTGAILGNLYGAAYGHAALPKEWASQVEGRDVVVALAELWRGRMSKAKGGPGSYAGRPCCVSRQL